jgi:hypothetical protein
MEHIGSLNEKPLHAALKAWYAMPDDQVEVPIDGFVIDILRDELLIEIQTGGFAKIKRKLFDLVERHPLRLVYPIPREKWLVKLDLDQERVTSRRKSPKRGSEVDLFVELVSFPKLVARSNFALEILLTQEEEIWRYDGRRGWRRRGWVVHERRLLQVVDRHQYQTPSDFMGLLPGGLPQPFTTADLATALSRPRRVAQKMAYCLRKMGALHQVGQKGRAKLYQTPDGGEKCQANQHSRP